LPLTTVNASSTATGNSLPDVANGAGSSEPVQAVKIKLNNNTPEKISPLSTHLDKKSIKPFLQCHHASTALVALID
ncbi:MAG: hypothetical protein WBO73_15570, partial [Gammaproteobacteria bacterium]